MLAYTSLSKPICSQFCLKLTKSKGGLHKLVIDNRLMARQMKQFSSHMKAWQIQEIGSVEDMKMETIRVPPIVKPNDVLIQVNASSVNPLDTVMIGGYGNKVISVLKTINSLEEGSVDCSKNVFPFIGGRDFSGEVVAVGHTVKELSIGEKVYGVIGPQRPGAHSEYVITPSTNVCKIPDGLSATEAAVIPYAALTAWSAIVVSGGVRPYSASGARVLVLGASGGVGTFLVQMLNAWGAEVVGVCSSEAFEFVTSLGVLELYDYQDPETKQILTSYQSFDLILDASGNNDRTYIDGLKKWCGASYVSLSSPLLRNTDKHGMITGGLKSAIEILSDNYSSLSEGRTHKWGFYMDNPCALSEINKMVSSGKIRAMIDKTFPFEETPNAYKHLIHESVHGKTAIEVNA